MSPRRRGRARRCGPDAGPGAGTTPPPLGGRLRPLAPEQSEAIVEGALSILERTGIADAPPALADRALAAGARRRADGRLTFPRPMVEAAIARAARSVLLPGFEARFDLRIGGGHVHLGTGGAAVQVLDAPTLRFREATLLDLRRLMRIVGRCEHLHYGVRPVVARDVPTPLELDLNTAFACLEATAKPIGVSFDSPEHVAPVVRMLDLALGGDGAYRERPCCFAVVVHVVSPLRYSADGVATMGEAIAAGMPLQICAAGQAGATSPVTLAGALAQGLAEVLAGLMVVDCLRPGFPCIFAFMPFVSDLRTGAMTGGGGEGAIANAAAAQLLRELGLPSTVAAGMTDAKLVDAQAGYEKGYTVALAAHAGADMINLCAGMLGSITAASPEALVVDNDMCGAILRSVRGVETPAGAVDPDLVERVATGAGHYLGEAQTLARMRSEYVYPALGDRRSVAAWGEEGGGGVWERAVAAVAALDRAEPPGHLPPDREAAIRASFPIRLPEARRPRARRRAGR